MVILVEVEVDKKKPSKLGEAGRQVGNFLVWWLKDPFFLRQHGDTLLTWPVKVFLGVLTIVLLFAMLFELFAWGSSWQYVASEVWYIGLLLVIVPFLFAGIVTMLDRGIAVMPKVMDKANWWVVPLRIAFLAVLATITAIPVELEVFKEEINRDIEQVENLALAQIREKAKAFEIGLSEKRGAATEAAVSNEPDAVDARRKAELEALLAQQAAMRAPLEQAVKDASAAVQKEITQGGNGRKRGAGTVTNDLRQELKTAQTALREFDSAAAAERKEFHAQTQSMREGALKSGIATRESADTKLEEKLHRIEVMEAEELIAAYGGDYEVPKGFLARYQILQKLIHQDTEMARYANQVVWGCRIVMVMFTLAILFIKMVMETLPGLAYYSTRAQMFAGNDDIIQAARGLAMDKNTESVEAVCQMARVTGDEKYLEIVRTLAKQGNVVAVATLCDIGLNGGTDEDHTVIRELAIKGNAMATKVVHLRGRESSNAKDREVLAVLGIDPEQEVAYWAPAIVKGRQQVYESRKVLADKLAQGRDFMREICMERIPESPDGGRVLAQPRRVINQKAREWWRKEMLPLIEQEGAAIYRLNHSGGKTPEWPKAELGEDDPTAKAWVNWWEMDDDDLVMEFGWEAPAPNLRAMPSA